MGKCEDYNIDKHNQDYKFRRSFDDIGIHFIHNSKKEDLWYVYFITDGYGCVKIGASKEPTGRLRDLQTSNPHELSLIGYHELDTRKKAFSLEAELHHEFERDRLNGEWFKLDWPILNYLKKHFQVVGDLKSPIDYLCDRNFEILKEKAYKNEAMRTAENSRFIEMLEIYTDYILGDVKVEL